jgi:hypothetical protein
VRRAVIARMSPPPRVPAMPHTIYFFDAKRFSPQA